MKTMKWLLKREFWEHKGSIFWAPAILGMVMVAVTVITISYALATNGGAFNMKINGQMQSIQSLLNKMSTAEYQSIVSVLTNLCLGVGAPLLLLLGLTSFFYCLGALHDERRDRSILFWKSLPLSDTQTVLSKVAMVTVVAPLIVIAISSATSLVLMLIVGAVAALNGVNVFGALLSNQAVYLLPLQALGVLPVYLLCALPTVGWLLMVSAWAKSKVFLWAVGGPGIALVLAKWIGYLLGNDTAPVWLMQNIGGRMLLGLVPGNWLLDYNAPPAVVNSKSGRDALEQAWAVVGMPDVWIAAAAGMLMIYAAIRLRRFKDEG